MPVAQFFLRPKEGLPGAVGMLPGVIRRPSWRPRWQLAATQADSIFAWPVHGPSAAGASLWPFVGN
jgi:hypothetical protein